MTDEENPNITIYDDLIQGTPEWHEARRGVITASNIHNLFTAGGDIANNKTSRGYAKEIAKERVTSLLRQPLKSIDLLRGTYDEPYAREVYVQHTKQDVELCGFIVRDFGNVKIGYSPDGLVGRDGLIEIKSKSSKLQFDMFVEPPEDNPHLLQMVTGMLVTGRKWCDFVSFASEMPVYIERLYWFEYAERESKIIEAAVNCNVLANCYAEKYTQSVGGFPIAPVVNYEDEDSLIV